MLIEARPIWVGYIPDMSDRSRIALAVSWIVVAGLLTRMAWGGSLLGILYVVRAVHPLTLLVGAFSILIAGGVTFSIVIRPSRRTLWVSTGLSIFVIPLSLVLAGDGHGSAVALGAAAVAALAIAVRALGRYRDPTISAAITPGRPDGRDERPA